MARASIAEGGPESRSARIDRLRHARARLIASSFAAGGTLVAGEEAPLTGARIRRRAGRWAAVAQTAVCETAECDELSRSSAGSSRPLIIRLPFYVSLSPAVHGL